MEMSQEEIMPIIQKPRTCINVPKSQAQKLRIGQMVNYTVVGKVVGIHDTGSPVKPNEEEKYGLTVEIEELKLQGNTADVEYQKLKEAE